MLDPEFIGYRLLQRGFKDFFLYLFRIVEGRPFVLDLMHEDLFTMFQAIYNQEEKRVLINISPRSAKTTLAKYFIAYCWTLNPRCNFIYTSYSEDLLKSIARELAVILEHPVYKAMFPQHYYKQEEQLEKPIDEFWAEYLEKETGHNIYSSKKIVTYMGGVCLFSAMGSQITGYGAGIRNGEGFTGALILDDPNKPADIRSAIMRDRVLRFYEETLLSRLNNSDVPILGIQQRLHVEDLTGLLEQKYTFKKLCKPLLDENNVCQLPSQYTQERIKELQQNNYVFQAQFQQCPIILGGQVIKRDWFKYFPTSTKFKYKRVLIAADTAIKIKEHNDFSVFIVGAVTMDNKLHILEIVRGKWEAPELEKVAINLWNKYKREPETGLNCSGMYVEDKASGSYLIQGLRTKYSIPVFGVQADTDKLTRVEGILSYVEAGYVFLPESENYGFNQEFLKECEAFSRDQSQAHDDQVDAFAYLVAESLAKRTVSILDAFY